MPDIIVSFWNLFLNEVNSPCKHKILWHDYVFKLLCFMEPCLVQLQLQNGPLRPVNSYTEQWLNVITDFQIETTDMNHTIAPGTVSMSWLKW